MTGEDDDFEAVVAAVGDRIDPGERERQRMREAVAALTERAEEAIADLPVSGDVIQVGSTARGTWISGDRDIDLFVRFPADADREELESYGLRVGHAVLPEGREEYAEHPYVTGEYDGFDVDLVPCYRLDSATDIRSAVDRTPFHNEYLDERIDADLAGEVRLFKQFLKGIGAYGSDLRTRGFSGYLTELLVLEYGGFRETVEAAAEDWHPPVRFDPEDHGQAEFDDPLVVIDPTDPERNVAAVCAPENVARLQHYARELLERPREDLFFPDPTDPLSADEVRDHVRKRGTTPVALRFDAPDVVEDQLYPQLRKSVSGVRKELDRRGFDALRAATFADESAVLFVELAVAERPAVERHEGPPVHVRQHAEGFYGKYADGSDDSGGSGTAAGSGPPYGPFIDGDRYVVEREREFETAAAFLESDALFGVALGVHVESALANGYDLLVGEAVGELAAEFGAELAEFFDPEP
ncbi:CCA tRNA nucleotidyltransferase [Halorussus sp. MSC15.2]|uniref:CCA tRNA nucleotidyltransferase n=1 Tax=Halorussus sp. MSC15.2 TaxID=2283638 RepID=UPI0013D69DDC|nr:CCA tRNA nucleotidyltransferase [Halorussus sp. MSC15.2]NEU58885.1 CCA tRNA nucleotidyltransferase [Halorussus sp. MSC15.2]